VVVRPDHLGDVLLALPGAAALRGGLPGAQLAFAVPSAVAAVPAHCPHVDEVLGIRFPPLGTPWDDRVLRAEARRLAGRFDVALVPRPDDPWSGALVAAARVAARLGFDLPRTRPFLTVALPPPGREHVVRHLLRLVPQLSPVSPDAALACPPPGQLLVPSEEERGVADALLTELGSPAPVVLHPGSGWPLKNWPGRRWGQLATALHAASGTRPLVLGTAGEADLVGRVVTDSDGAAVGLAGRLCLGALAAVLGRARLVVGTDSGAMHLAAFVGAPTVTLFGPADPDLFTPLGPAAHRVLRLGLPCRPCGTLVDPPCAAATEPACVTGISVDDVLDAARLALETRHG
jgi:ADP-heptose:LPS heptosyltransferase